ncbi:hypothetical protein ASPCAL13695 [Aspergillus calidoustus]|uniref:Uncharacterized protein n=1 Tax=Aspergillus calidoustus TaxID=454130 RepID=A0A0U5GE12_ASPCI|nr:hypothetical protein ASPCAL13695 [Aspergillus calidoustus]
MSASIRSGFAGAPMGRSCGAGANPSEQDWERQAFARITNWYKWFRRQYPVEMVGNIDVANEILNFDFEMVDEPNTRDAVWLEALQRKRYCCPAPGNQCQRIYTQHPPRLFP